jgi:20S proteasome alpha/beta subunit
MLALKPRPAFRPKSRRLPREKTMTIAAGFTCSDGLVLCADTQETITGYAKVNTQKMTQIETPFYNMVFTGSGDSGLIDMTVQLMEQALTLTQQLSGVWEIEKTLRESLVDTFNRHIAPWSQFAETERPITPDLLIGLQFPAATLLYRAGGTTLRRVYESQCVGTGVVLAKSLMAKMFHHGLSIAQGWLIALYTLYQAKTWVDGCGGNSDILLLSNRDRKITRIPTSDITEMEQHFSAFDIYLRPVFLSAADRNISQAQFDEQIKQLRFGMLNLRGKFMEFEEFTKHLTDLIGHPIPDLFTTPEPSAPPAPQSEKP